jgi:hypothetical protein
VSGTNQEGKNENAGIHAQTQHCSKQHQARHHVPAAKQMQGRTRKHAKQTRAMQHHVAKHSRTHKHRRTPHPPCSNPIPHHFPASKTKSRAVCYMMMIDLSQRPIRLLQYLTPTGDTLRGCTARTLGPGSAHEGLIAKSESGDRRLAYARLLRVVGVHVGIVQTCAGKVGWELVE